MPLKSTTRLLYPNIVPLSVIIILSFFNEVAFSTTFLMSNGDKNCPFFMFIIFPTLAASNIKSVCLHKKAGICIISNTWAASSISLILCISESIGMFNSFFKALSIYSPFFIPGPLYEFTDVLLALS